LFLSKLDLHTTSHSVFSGKTRLDSIMCYGLTDPERGNILHTFTEWLAWYV